MKTDEAYTSDHGLLVKGNTACGYIFNFAGHGAFAPHGKVRLKNGVLRDLTQDEIDTHNRLLGEAEFAALKKNGRGIMYLTREKVADTVIDSGSQRVNAECVRYYVSLWSGTGKTRVSYQRKSFHNMAGKDGRTDVWFTLDGSNWHGVNIGDNQICRVRRCKKLEHSNL